VTKGVTETAFAVLREFHHSSIVSEVGKTEPGEGVSKEELKKLHGLILDGLRTTDAGSFKKHCAKAQEVTQATYAPDATGAHAPIFQQFFVKVLDEHDQPVNDFTLEFYVRPKGHIEKGRGILSKLKEIWNGSGSQDVHELITAEFHTCTTDSSYRRFLIDLQAVKAALPADHCVTMTVHLAPIIKKDIVFDDVEDILLYDPDEKKDRPDATTGFHPNTTTFMELRVNRRNQLVQVFDEFPPKR
jgi:hypothetical protein